jgi:hypothetical protein
MMKEAETDPERTYKGKVYSSSIERRLAELEDRVTQLENKGKYLKTRHSDLSPVDNDR